MKTKVLITAGPTRAFLDEVRYISNFSSGKLGFNLASVLVKKGADVYVVAGPTSQPFETLRLKKFFPVETNAEMLSAVLRVCEKDQPQWAIFSAAVLDFVPKKKSSGKVSSAKKNWTIELEAAPKIIDVVQERHPEIKRIGFKLEWEKRRGAALKSFAKKQLQKRALEYLVVNFLEEIEGTRHRASIFDRNLDHTTVHSKEEIAKELTCHVLGR